MKKIYKLFPITCTLLLTLAFVLSSCDKMDDIQREYAEKEEQVYLGKVDSVKNFPGFGRAKLTWYIGSDPKVQRTIIYWNMRKDSIVKEFIRTTPGIQKDSIIFENLPEGSTLFEFRNVNDAGETSLYSSITVTVWGTEFANRLRARSLTAFDFDYEQSLFGLSLSPTAVKDNILYSEIVYTNKLGKEQTIKIERVINKVELADFQDGGDFRFRTVFFPPQGIDMVYSDFKTFRAPKAISERGSKISFIGKMASKYFEGNGSNLYEWNAAGDLILYAMNKDGSLTQTDRYPVLVPRATYRDFFFYDEDKFIGINTANAVSMHQIQNRALVFVKATPASTNTFGTGFSMPKFIPTRGFFFSMDATTGHMKTWVAQNNATWGTPNGTQVGTGYTIYEPLMMFNHQALLGVDAQGYLWSTPVSITGTLGSRSRIGTGWNRFKKIMSVGTTILAMEQNGDFYAFPNFSATEKYWIVN